MRAGKLRHRVEIQERATSRDAHGNPVETWSTAAPVFASVEPLTGNEKLTQQKITASVTHKITIRARTVTPRSRVLFDGRVFDVNSSLDLEERGREVHLFCTEAV